MKRLILSLFWLGASLICGKLLNQYFQPVELLYAIILWIVPLLFFGIQKHTWAEKRSWKVLGAEIYSSDTMYERTQFFFIPLGKAKKIHVEREILPDPDGSKKRFITETVIPKLLDSIRKPIPW